MNVTQSKRKTHESVGRYYNSNTSKDNFIASMESHNLHIREQRRRKEDKIKLSLSIGRVLFTTAYLGLYFYLAVELLKLWN